MAETNKNFGQSFHPAKRAKVLVLPEQRARWSECEQSQHPGDTVV